MSLNLSLLFCVVILYFLNTVKKELVQMHKNKKGSKNSLPIVIGKLFLLNYIIYSRVRRVRLCVV